jgi:CheY-like chemotaxis protein
MPADMSSLRSAPGGAAAARKILVVDDDKPLCHLMAKALTDGGYQTFTAYSGAEAVEVFRAERPDLLVLDFAMPGMNGYEVVAEIRKLERSEQRTLIMLVTAYSQAFLVSQDFRLSVDGYVTKPILPSDLLARVEDLFANQ